LIAFSGERIGYIFLLFLLFGFAGLPFTYVLAFLFDSASSAYSR
jgi:hypothetical protein